MGWTIDYFKSELDPNIFGQTSFYLYCLAGMENSKQKILNAGYKEISFEMNLPAGITGLSKQPDDDKETLIAMQNQALKAKIGNMKLEKYHLGYGGAEALYFSDGYRVPNSVYPLFWWRKLANSAHDWSPMFSGR